MATIVANAAQKKVLFYGSTHQSGRIGETLVNNSPTEFYPIGQGSDIWTPGDPNPAKDWNKKTTADFQVFDAIIIGDLSIPLQNTPDKWTGAILNRATWSAAISGNILLFAGDPEFHAQSQTGAIQIIQQGIRLAADDPAAGPGCSLRSPKSTPPRQAPLIPCNLALHISSLDSVVSAL